MSGRKITRSQVRLYMESKRIKKTQLSAAARAEISVSSAHRIEKGIVTGAAKARDWRTRKDPFEGIWATVIEPQLALLSLSTNNVPPFLMNNVPLMSNLSQ